MRRAELADIPQLMPFARAFHAQAAIGPAFDPDTVQGFLSGMIEGQSSVVLLTDHGSIGGVIVPAYCDPTWKIAVELFWWAEKGGLTLLTAFEKWAADMGANEVRMTSLASLPRADRVLRLKDYQPAEISYQKVL